MRFISWYVNEKFNVIMTKRSKGSYVENVRFR
jgi:hypothetical protein